MAPVIRSSIDAALWFHKRAQANKSGLAAQKLQRLLYLAQAHFAGASGKALMPATFLAGELGPYEPSVYVVFEAGPPEVSAFPVSGEAEAALDLAWRLYGGKSADDLAGIIAADGAYLSARMQGIGTEIQLPAMMAVFHGVFEAEPGKTIDSLSPDQSPAGAGRKKPGKKPKARLSSETVLNVLGEEELKPALILRGGSRQGGLSEGKRRIDEIAESLALAPKASSRSSKVSSDGPKEVVKWRPKRNITRH